MRSCRLLKTARCIVFGEAKEGITEAQFQEFIDGPMGPNFGIGAMNNNISKIDLELTGGQAPYERKL